MSGSVRKGYCRDCRANVKHVRRFVSNICWLCDAMTFQFVGRFRFGSWHCLQCTKRTIYLKLPRPGARSLEIGTSSVGSNTESDSESAGNYLRRDQSLVARRDRSSRFSSKYRESIVQKILDGHVTISEMRRELGISEADLIDWIASVVAEQAEKIDQLSQIVNSLGINPEQQVIANPMQDSDIDVIDAMPTRKASATRSRKS